MAKKHQKLTHKKHFKVHTQKKILWVIVILMSVSILLAVSFVDYTKYEWEETDADGTGVYTTAWKGQNFTVGTVGTDESFLLNGVALTLYKAGAGSYCEVILTDSENMRVGGIGNILSNGSYDATTGVASPGQWENITMESTTLDAATTYSFFLNCSGTDPNGAGIRIDNTAGYTGGSYVGSSDNGATWTTTAWDLTFRIF